MKLVLLVFCATIPVSPLFLTPPNAVPSFNSGEVSRTLKCKPHLGQKYTKFFDPSLGANLVLQLTHFLNLSPLVLSDAIMFTVLFTVFLIHINKFHVVLKMT